MFEIKKIKKKSVSEEVFEQLKNNIVKQLWSPGDKLPSENDLAEMFGVSRVSIRAAIHKLIALGILEARNGEGTFVKHVNPGVYFNSLIPMLVLEPRDILELLEFRKGIERLSCELAAERATGEEIETLGKLVEDMKKSCSENNTGKFTEDDFNFHMCIAKLSKNSVIENVLTILRDHIIAHFSEMHNKIGLDLNIENHVKIFEAIKRHDPKAASFYIEESLKRSMEKVRENENR